MKGPAKARCRALYLFSAALPLLVIGVVMCAEGHEITVGLVQIGLGLLLLGGAIWMDICAVVRD